MGAPQSRWLAAVLVGALVTACQHAPPAVAAAPPTGESVLPFIENDSVAAINRARELGLPLFVEQWAPW